MPETPQSGVNTPSPKPTGAASSAKGAAQPRAALGDIRPFRVNTPQADLDDLRKRVLATRLPDKETVADQSQGVQLATIQTLAQLLGERTTTGASARRG